MVQISSYNYVNNQIFIFMELKLTRIFKSLGIALSETNRLYEYRQVTTPKGKKLYVKKLKPVFDNGIAELYRFKRGDKTFVFIIDKGKTTSLGRRLVFDNWPAGQSSFVMLLDDIIMVASRISGSNQIDCHDLSFITSLPVRRVIRINGPKKPVAPEEILYEGKVLSIGKVYYYLNFLADNELAVNAISEWMARDIRHRSFAERDKYKWTPIPLLDSYKL